MIDKTTLDSKDTLYKYEGRYWEVRSTFSTPSVTMQCITDGEILSFGFGSLIDEAFKELREVKK